MNRTIVAIGCLAIAATAASGEAESRSGNYVNADLPPLMEFLDGYDVSQGQVGIIGFSRYGKQSLYAAAFDERFTSVVARSSGTPTAVAYRFAGRQTFMESIEDSPSAWARPSLRAYHGRENELPIEGHGLLALISPRRCMLHTAYNDGSDPTFGVERSYLQGLDVYRFLGKPENLRNSYRIGNHVCGLPNRKSRVSRLC